VQQAIDELKPNGLPAGTLFADVMDTWTKQSGFPLISVFRTSQTEIMLSQVRGSVDLTLSGVCDSNLS